MERVRRCKLCGQPIVYNDLFGHEDWRNNYCTYVCYSVDQMLPEVECEKEVYSVPAWVARVRYSMIVEGENSSVYREPFQEEEDDIIRDNYED
jgi:hypothetical protein